MDDTRYVIRPFADADFAVASRIWSRVEPEQPISAEELRHQHRALEDPARFRQFLLAEERGSDEGVALGSLSLSPWADDPERYWIEVAVDPDHRARGIGRELYRILEEEAVSRRAKGLWGSVRADDHRSVRFFERVGFVEQRRSWISRLDLTAAHLPPSPRSREDWAAEGVEFTTFLEEGPDRPEARERLYRLDLVTSRDVPRMGPPPQFSFEQYVAIALHGPGFVPEGVFLARVRGEYVAMSSLERLPSEPDTLHVGFTGTLRPFRGRGIASELKRQAVEYARAHGFRYLRTVNDSQNRPIWAINEKLGFHREQTWIEGQKEFELPGWPFGAPTRCGFQAGTVRPASPAESTTHGSTTHPWPAQGDLPGPARLCGTTNTFMAVRRHVRM